MAFTVASSNIRLVSSRPARAWTEAWPLGNGRLGVMAFGGIGYERLGLNEESLYSGSALPQGQPDVKGTLAEVRQLLAEGRYGEADRKVSREWLGRGQECYQPLGNLELRFRNVYDPAHYERSLDLHEGVARVSFTSEGVRHFREYFVSASDGVLVARVRTEAEGHLHMRLRLRSPHPGASAIDAGSGAAQLSGQLPEFCLRRSWEWIVARGDEWKYPEVYDEAGERKKGAAAVLYGDEAEGRGMRFHSGLFVRLNGGGKISADGEVLVIEEATEVMVVLAAASSYARHDRPADEDAEALVNQRLLALHHQDYETLRERHGQSHRALMDRVRLTLDEGNADGDVAVRWRGEAARELKLAEAAFHFGRYLLISSSHPSCRHPANLQGIWNQEIKPPWASAYTTNINLEMNYWPAGPANLAECNEPLFRLIEECAENGRVTAAESYGLPGWVLHHNTDVWRKTDPVDFTARTAYWPMGSGWLCCHLWEHFLFTRDERFLKERAYPLMKGACEFYLGWLVENAEGWLVTPVSTSPENDFRTADGESASVSAGCTMDMSILRELFGACEKAGGMCGDEEFSEQVAAARGRLLPLQIGRLGQVQEWAGDWDRADDHHRHISHLFAVHPGTQITRRTPELQRAALRTLELRGDGGTGWSLAWKASQYARLNRAEKAWSCLRALLQPAERNEQIDDRKCDSEENLGGLYPNFFAACPPFQIDANFGFVAAVCEMLLQSHEGAVEFLPALPEAWRNGSVSGLKARGGLEIGIVWRGGALEEATVRVEHDGTYSFGWGVRRCERELRAGQTITLTGEDFL